MTCKCSHIVPDGANFCPECGRQAPKAKVAQKGFLGGLPALLTAAEAASLLKCSLWMVYELAKQDKLPHFRLGKQLRFSSKALMTWAENQSSITTAHTCSQSVKQ